MHYAVGSRRRGCGSNCHSNRPVNGVERAHTVSRCEYSTPSTAMGCEIEFRVPDRRTMRGQARELRALRHERAVVLLANVRP